MNAIHLAEAQQILVWLREASLLVTQERLQEAADIYNAVLGADSANREALAGLSAIRTA